MYLKYKENENNIKFFKHNCDLIKKIYYRDWKGLSPF